jgi:hypothetical protein
LIKVVNRLFGPAVKLMPFLERRDHMSNPFVSLRKLRAVSTGIAGRKSDRALIFSEAERRARIVKIEFLIGWQ